MADKDLPTKPPQPTQTPPVAPTAFLDAIAHRHSIYKLNNTSPLSPTELEAILRKIMLTTPSAFNTQSTRAVLLVHTAHTHFWTSIVGETLLESADMKAAAEKDADKPVRLRRRLDGFAHAFGSVLFFEAGARVDKLLGMAGQYGEATVRGWSDHTAGMHQLVAWTAFEAAGLGANLQHYNYDPDIARKTLDWLGLPADWDMKAQLVFGGVDEGGWPTAPKDKDDPSESVRVFGV